MANNFSIKQTAQILNVSESSLSKGRRKMGMKSWRSQTEGQLGCCEKCTLAWMLQEERRKQAEQKEAARKLKELQRKQAAAREEAEAAQQRAEAEKRVAAVWAALLQPGAEERAAAKLRAAEEWAA
eukprot:217212-Rhodomonas_salina.1